MGQRRHADSPSLHAPRSFPARTDTQRVDQSDSQADRLHQGERVPAHATTVYGMEADTTGAAWRARIRGSGSIERDREALARLVDEDQDPAEVYYYEAVSDPDVRAMNRAQRSYAGQYERRLRRLAYRRRHSQ
uniref:Uncharacterized protein n=2 Tax=Salinispora arenicola TaxID=168697 RepID=A8LZK6_SALAI